ncbi:MAG: uracil phosphoribosyltransferase [Fimbriimonadaceae bacterium]
MALHVLDHPLSQHLVASLRDKSTQPQRFRQLTKNLTTLLVLEATKGLRLVDSSVETPLEYAQAKRLGQSVAAVPVLRAGLGMLEPVTELFPEVAVGYIGLERSEDTAIAHSYYSKLPQLEATFTLCLDPMLATGGSASQALSFIKAKGADRVVMVCIVAAPEGVSRIQQDHPDVDIFTSALDRELDHRKYILPGLGDFGDRLYGTQ